MKYKVGDEFIVKIKEVMDSDNGTLYRSNFNTLVFDEYGLDKLQKYDKYAENLERNHEVLKIFEEKYNQGLQDAWELARKVSHMCLSDMNKCFDLEELDKFGGDRMLYEHYTPQGAFAKIEAYEESKAIKVGDEIVVVGHAIKGYVIDKSKEYEDCYVVLITNYKDLRTAIYNKTVIKKTGRHIDITQILEQIRGE